MSLVHSCLAIPWAFPCLAGLVWCVSIHYLQLPQSGLHNLHHFKVCLDLLLPLWLASKSSHVLLEGSLLPLAGWAHSLSFPPSLSPSLPPSLPLFLPPWWSSNPRTLLVKHCTSDLYPQPCPFAFHHELKQQGTLTRSQQSTRAMFLNFPASRAK
jgi:hypothetical protein